MPYYPLRQAERPQARRKKAASRFAKTWVGAGCVANSRASLSHSKSPHGVKSICIQRLTLSASSRYCLATRSPMSARMPSGSTVAQFRRRLVHIHVEVQADVSDGCFRVRLGGYRQPRFKVLGIPGIGPRNRVLYPSNQKLCAGASASVQLTLENQYVGDCECQWTRRVPSRRFWR